MRAGPPAGAQQAVQAMIEAAAWSRSRWAAVPVQQTILSAETHPPLMPHRPQHSQITPLAHRSPAPQSASGGPRASCACRCLALHSGQCRAADGPAEGMHRAVAAAWAANTSAIKHAGQWGSTAERVLLLLAAADGTGQPPPPPTMAQTSQPCHPHGKGQLAPLPDSSRASHSPEPRRSSEA